MAARGGGGDGASVATHLTGDPAIDYWQPFEIRDPMEAISWPAEMQKVIDKTRPGVYSKT